MPRFKRKKITVDQAGKKHGFRSGLEEGMIAELEGYNIEPNYEAKKFEYVIPESKHIYTPDFPVSPHIVIETKGRWVVEDRQKMLLIIKQYPDIDFRMIFYNANQKIKKGSKTTYAMWCDKHGIKWANKNIPNEWLKDIYDDIARSESEKKENNEKKVKKCDGLDCAWCGEVCPIVKDKKCNKKET